MRNFTPFLVFDRIAMSTIAAVGSENALRPENHDAARLRKAAHDLQGVLFYEVLKTARQTIPQNEEFGLGVSGDIFYGMLDEHVAEVMSERMSSKLTEAIYRQLAGGVKRTSQE